MRYAVIDKQIGETPLEALNRFKTARGLPSSLTSCYAGRLDPMASGKLLVLFGNECKKLPEYTGLDKEYVIEVLLGVGSDTGDVLGIPVRGDAPSLELVSEALKQEVGVHEHPYPAFSSKTVNGKPLFLYSLEGTINSIKIPTHLETFYSIRLLKQEKLTANALRARVEQILSKTPASDEPSKVLGADFRIGSVRPAWDRLLQEERAYHVLTLRVTCGSGAYMRTLAGRIGESLESKGLALSITRTRIGSYLSLLRLWRKSFT